MTVRSLAYLLPLLSYFVFAALVFFIHGSEPELSVDHIAYFKLADEIRAHHPDGSYWRAFDALHIYSILVAYVTDLTGSHIVSMKVILAGMTVAYLVAFERLMLVFTNSRPAATLFSLLSALYVSFGAPFWGMTDFTASLHRTLVVPLFVLILWLFFALRDSPWRYVSYALLVALSLVHLSSYHTLLVLLVFELVDFVFLRRCRLDRRLLHFAAGLAFAIGVWRLVAWSGLGSAGFVGQTLGDAWGVTHGLTTDEAWVLELRASPWRNVPIPVLTLGNIALSYGLIFLLSVAAVIAIRRRDGWNRLDRMMLAFAGAVVLAAYGLQTLMWTLRSFVPIYPVNFEEIRSISLIMIPSVYFVSRLVLRHSRGESSQHRLVAAIVVVAFVLQPILVVRSLPVAWREAMLERLSAANVLPRGDTLRGVYARQYLGLGGEGPRFYYSARGVLDWLDRNATASDRLLTDRNELRLAPVEVVGAFGGFVTALPTDSSRRAWNEEVDAVATAFASHDVGVVLKLAKELRATLVVVPWSAPGAVYQDGNVSVLRAE